MIKKKIGNVAVYMPDGVILDASVRSEVSDMSDHADADILQLREIVMQYPEADYHSQITRRRNWTAMYQLEESRGNVIEWLDFPKNAKVLELGAGCGAITSVLLNKGLRVTCQEETIDYSRMNAYRHQQTDKLEIYAMPFAQCESRLDTDYDVVILIGILEDTQADRMLKQLQAHLAPDGRLVIAVENQFGLKYWAGSKEAHTHQYFAGLENTAGAQGRYYFTKRRLEELLVQAGCGTPRFYYPYPDHRFALDIYSDEYLPKKGSLNYNITNYEDDRLVLFDEQKVYDSIIEEGLYPLFANSYLCLAGKNSKTGKNSINHNSALFTRYAFDRAAEYAIRTDMRKMGTKADGRIFVRKVPLHPQGAAHISHIAEAYKRLCRQYGHTDLKFNRCKLVSKGKSEEGKQGAEFEFIQGQGLQSVIQQAAASQNIEKIFDILRKMMHYIRNDKNSHPFVLTEEFTHVFGPVSETMLPALSAAALCSEVSDIDLVLPNILIDDEGIWNVIDYEWTFFFPIPQNFIIYRTLFFLNHEYPKQEELSMDRLLKFAGITQEEAAAYGQMEEGFQNYVTGGQVPCREMVNLLERRFLNVTELKAENDQLIMQNERLRGRGIWKTARKMKHFLQQFHGRTGVEGNRNEKRK